MSADQIAATPVKILLVEDNPADARLTRELLTEGKVLNRMEVVSDGVSALEYLRQQGAYASVDRPDMILLDLNLPRMNGLELLEIIKADEALKTIPVIVLSTSQAETDISDAYAKHAAAFVSKPVDLDQFVTVVKAVEDFWFSVVRLPPRNKQQVD